MLRLDAKEGEGSFDKREVLVDVLKTAIPSGFRKEELGRDIGLGKRRSVEKKEVPATTSLSTGSGKTRDPEDEALSTRATLRRLERKKAKEADQRIAEIKAKGTRWWMHPTAKRKPPQGWLDMPSSEITADVKRDLDVLSMRGAFNPKRHYRVSRHTVYCLERCALPTRPFCRILIDWKTPRGFRLAP